MYQDTYTNSEHSGEPYRADWTDYEQPSTAIVEAVARVTGCEQTDLDPLYQYVDGDALNSLLGNSDTGLMVSFAYGDAWVDISATGSLTVEIDD